jgi:hypothetical protein
MNFFEKLEAEVSCGLMAQSGGVSRGEEATENVESLLRSTAKAYIKGG